MTARNVTAQWRNFTIVREMIRANTQIDLLLQAGQNLAFERGRTNVMLALPEPESDQNLEFIAARRKASDERFTVFFADPGIRALPQGRHLLEDYTDIKRLREEVDRNFSLPAKQRDASLVPRWMTASTHLIEEMGALCSMLALTDERYAVSFRGFSRMKTLAYDLRNSAGTEASLIAANVIAGHGLRTDTFDRIQTLRGETGAIWTILKREGQINGDSVVLDGLELVDRRFFRDFRLLQDTALATLRNTGVSSISSSTLTSGSVPALDSIASLMSILTERTTNTLDKTLASARWSLGISITMAALALTFGILTNIILIGRLIRPLNEIGMQLQNLTKGDLSAEIRPVGKNDEIARASAIVSALRDSLLERNKLETELRKMSNSDGLTGLANRRCMDSTLEEEWNRALRSGTPIAVAMFDVDHFKNYNDHYGHLAGDECLKTIARVLEAYARRPGDLATRFGGEEFLVILPGLDRTQCLAWAEQVREAIELTGIPHAESPTGTVTVSCGLMSLIPTQRTSILEIIRLADEAIYRAKAEGRNKVVAG
jgi:diguanylate cyclase (GGDEF)-like protein